MNNIPTKQASDLAKALRKRGIRVETEYWDGHKHVDIYVTKIGLYIEVDGLQHYTHPDQIIADLKREHYSDKDDFYTMHITNQIIEKYLEEVADAIKEVVESKG